MKTSKRMKDVIGKILEAVGERENNPKLYVKVTQDGYDRLVIEAIGHRCISVAHYFEQNGDLIADPEVVFFRDQAGNWIAIETTMVMIGTRRYAELGKVNGKTQVVSLNVRMQADLASFTTIWAKNIREQGWVRMARMGLVKTKFAPKW